MRPLTATRCWILDEVNVEAIRPTTMFARFRRSFEPLSRSAMSTSSSLSIGGTSAFSADSSADRAFEAMANICTAALFTSYSSCKRPSKTLDTNECTHLKHVQGVPVIVVRLQDEQAQQDLDAPSQICSVLGLLRSLV